MKLKLYPELIALCKLADTANLDRWRHCGPLYVQIADPHGITVICEKSFSENAERHGDIRDRSLWRFFQIDEIFDIDAVGVVAEFSRLLADRHISVFVISSFETDYLLVRPDTVENASEIFRRAGHSVSIL